MIWVEVDARGQRCPWPALRLARAFRQGARHVRLCADDPAAPQEIAALAAERGWRLSRDGEDFLVEGR
jgi:tRNA 2-thiouridine synthesizing protein A